MKPRKIMNIIPDYDGVLTKQQQCDILRIAGEKDPYKLSHTERSKKLSEIFGELKNEH